MLFDNEGYFGSYNEMLYNFPGIGFNKKYHEKLTSEEGFLKGNMFENEYRPYKNYTYILECADKSLYCGWTNHLGERVAAHNAGRGAKYTKSRRPVTLVYFEEFDTKQEAMRREWEVKRLSRSQKLALIARGRG